MSVVVDEGILVNYRLLMNASLPATHRFQIRSAPEGLRLTQDLLNTRPIDIHDFPDLLADPESAQTWLAEALQELATSEQIPVPTIVLSAHDLRRLRDLRSALVKTIEGEDELEEREHTALEAPMRLLIRTTGEATIEPVGEGWRWVAAVVLGEIYRAQQANTWKRLKLCGNPACKSAFYDTSKNNGGVWHDVRVCGNAINLRASRARRRAAESTDCDEFAG